MRCPNCRRENSPSARFCVFCGAPLPAEQPTQISLEDEVRRLREAVTRLDTRLNVLEQRQGIEARPVEATAEPVPQAAPTPALPPVPVPVEVWGESEPVASPPATARPARPARQPQEWEQILGGNWLATIGVLALLIGIGFFLKFAFDRNWIGPPVRIIMGIAAGLLMLGGGHLWRNKYPIMTRVLSGGGIGVMYLSVFAASAAYDLIPFIGAVVALLLVSACSVLLALRYNSVWLAILGITGAFIAPLLLAEFSAGVTAGGGIARGLELLVYILIVDVGVLVVSSLRNWRWFALIAFVFTAVLYGMWYDNFGTRAGFPTAFTWLTVLFLVFAGATTLFHLIWRKIPLAFDYVLMTLNATVYVSAGLGLLWPDYQAWAGAFLLLVSLFYGKLAYFAYRRNPDSHTLSRFALGIGIVALTVAVPVQLGDAAWTTVAWSIEAAGLVWLSLRLKVNVLRWLGYAAFGATAVRLLFFDVTLPMREYTLLINERSLAFVFGIAAMYVTAYLLAKQRGQVGNTERAATVPAFVIAANVFTLILLSVELWAFFDDRMRGRLFSTTASLRSAQTLALTVLWTVYAVALLVVGIWRRARFIRWGALALLAVAIGKVFVVDVFGLETVYRIVAFIGLGILLLVAAFLYQRYSKNIKEFLVKE